MKFGIVALGFEPGRTGGVETYLRDLIDGLHAIDPANTYVVFVLNHANALEMPGAHFKVVALRDRGLTRLLHALPFVRRRWTLQRRIEAHGCDVLHFPYQVIWPSGLTAPKVLSFQDMQHEHMPEFFSAKDLAWRKKTYSASCQEADHIVSISNYTRQDLLNRFGLPANKVTTVPLAYNERRFTGTASEEFELPTPYFYYPAGSWPHKNHLRLLDAFAEFLETHAEFHLVLTGLELSMSSDIESAIRRLELDERVTRLGYRPYEELPAIYRGAYALIYPSLFEGFGIPLLEAMASQCPIAASNAASIPEVGGDAALYFDPSDVAAITAAMTSLADSPELCAALVHQGNERCRKFTHTAMAVKTLQVYERVAG